ncbi:hypothetical protein [Bacteroides gallinaceum]|uniref:hypothetical protein n=1 Tax=Bacteroides gallinaceum TaxID=1462571 RepID=UPI00195B854B|nr:hypothetical protein [Bacteroides gallinaceum]MBM6659380.1 hypothetical protein [Bacteroides gallinaceum]
MIWDEFLRHFRFCDKEDSRLSDEEQERKGPKNRPKHTRKRIHQAKKNFLEKFKTASEYPHFPQLPMQGRIAYARMRQLIHEDVFRAYKVHQAISIQIDNSAPRNTTFNR